MTEPMRGMLWLDGWAGRYGQQVEVLAETPKRYRIRPADPRGAAVTLAGRRRYLRPGDTALVPKCAVTLDCKE